MTGDMTDYTMKVWSGFLLHEKLDPSRMSDIDVVAFCRLTSTLAERYPHPVPFRSHRDRLTCRRQVCEVAIEMLIDLAGMKDRVRGKTLMGRGLLDVWQVVYAEVFGSSYGTTAWFETQRRDARTRVARDLRGQTQGLRVGNAPGDPAPRDAVVSPTGPQE